MILLPKEQQEILHELVLRNPAGKDFLLKLLLILEEVKQPQLIIDTIVQTITFCDTHRSVGRIVETPFAQKETYNLLFQKHISGEHFLDIIKTLLESFEAYLISHTLVSVVTALQKVLDEDIQFQVKYANSFRESYNNSQTEMTEAERNTLVMDYESLQTLFYECLFSQDVETVNRVLKTLENTKKLLKKMSRSLKIPGQFPDEELERRQTLKDLLKKYLDLLDFMIETTEPNLYYFPLSQEFHNLRNRGEI